MQKRVADCVSIVFTLQRIKISFDKLINTLFLLNSTHLFDEAIRSLKVTFLHVVRDVNAKRKAARTVVIKKLFVRSPLLI